MLTKMLIAIKKINIFEKKAKKKGGLTALFKKFKKSDYSITSSILLSDTDVILQSFGNVS